MKVVVVGAGYVGLSTGSTLAYLGHQVTCLDVDEAKVEALKMGKATIFEPHLDHLLTTGAKKGLLSFSCDYGAIRDSEVIILAVNTPAGADGTPDTSYLDSALHSLGEALATAPSMTRVVVNKSTVPMGTGNYVSSRLAERNIAGFVVASNPEFLAEGTAMANSLYPDRIVIGCEGPLALEKLLAMYRPLIDQEFPEPEALPRPVGYRGPEVIATNTVTAEMIKYAANTFLAARVSLINELANICDLVGGDVETVARSIGLDPRIGPLFLRAGVGWGGSCFGKDLQAISAMAGEYGYEAQIINAVVDLNYRQRHLVVARLRERLKVLRGARIAVLGLAFKPETDDLRDAPAITVIEEILRGGASVRAFDPAAGERAAKYFGNAADCTILTDPYACTQGADAVVLMTEWKQFLALDFERIAGAVKRRIVIDGRNFLDRAALVARNWDYIGIGVSK